MTLFFFSISRQVFAKSKSIRNEKFLEKSVVDYTNPLSLHHGALQGKLLKSIRKLFKKMNYVPITKRKYLSSHEEFVHIAPIFLDCFLIDSVYHLII